MRHIDLSPSDKKPRGKSRLYLTEPPSRRLLLVVQADAQNHRDVATFATALTAESWNVLHVALPRGDADAVATIILDTLARAASELTAVPIASLQIVAVAYGAVALPACIATLQSHRQMKQPMIGGIATIDAFEQSAAISTAHRMPDIAAELAELDGLATLVAARRLSAETRRAGMSYHQQLQALGRETHYLVLAENDAPLLTQLADAHGALGREVRWLLDPVHSRNGA